MEKETTSVICPYNNQHVINRSIFQKHIVKCRRNFPPNYKETCPFNATHIMFEEEMEDHIRDCADKRFTEPEKYSILKNHGSLKSCPPSETERTLSNAGETWDERFNDFNDTTSIASQAPSTQSTLPPPLSIAEKNNLFGSMRPPKSQSIALMIDASDDSNVEDVESVTSSILSIGRGKKILQNNDVQQTPGFRRSRGANIG